MARHVIINEDGELIRVDAKFLKRFERRRKYLQALKAIRQKKQELDHEKGICSDSDSEFSNTVYCQESRDNIFISFATFFVGCIIGITFGCIFSSL